jgi:hypothetical protein
MTDQSVCRLAVIANGCSGGYGALASLSLTLAT